MVEVNGADEDTLGKRGEREGGGGGVGGGAISGCRYTSDLDKSEKVEVNGVYEHCMCETF